MDFVFGILAPVLVQGVVLAFGAERTTEIVKYVQRWIVSKIPKFAGGEIGGVGSAVVALAIIYAVIAYPGIDVDLLANFDALSAIDGELAPGLNTLILWVGARWLHSNVADRKEKDKK